MGKREVIERGARCRVDVTDRGGRPVASVDVLTDSTSETERRADCALVDLQRDYPAADHFFFRNFSYRHL